MRETVTAGIAPDGVALAATEDVELAACLALVRTFARHQGYANPAL